LSFRISTPSLGGGTPSREDSHGEGREEYYEGKENQVGGRYVLVAGEVFYFKEYAQSARNSSEHVGGSYKNPKHRFADLFRSPSNVMLSTVSETRSQKGGQEEKST